MRESKSATGWSAVSPDETYRWARGKARRTPAWLLRRRQAALTSASPWPTAGQLAELGAIRHELRIRSVRKAPLRWWSLW
jgi:hypothetical protein